MKPSPSAARRRAREVLHEAGCAELPVRVESVIERRGLSIQEVPRIRPGVFGAFYLDGTEAGIIVSQECFSHGHRRFTLAHELGHFVLEGHVEELLPAGSTMAVSLGGNFRSQSSVVEREADIFAAELLMPSHRVGFPSRLEPSVSGIRSFAGACGVSLSSAAIRLVDLVEEPVAVILSHDGAIEWYACSGPMREHRWARRSLRSEWVPRRSATSRLVSQPSASHEELEDRESLLLCEWFDGAPAMCRVQEECLRMGRYGRVLTILRPVDLPTADELGEESQRSREREREEDWRDAVRDWRWD